MTGVTGDPPSNLITACLNHSFNALPRLTFGWSQRVTSFPAESFDVKNRPGCLCSASVPRRFRSQSAHGSTQYPNLPPSSKGFSSLVSQCFPSESFSYCRLDIPTRPSAAAWGGNEILWPLSWSALDKERVGKGFGKTYSRSSHICCESWVLREFPFPLDLLPLFTLLYCPLLCWNNNCGSSPPHTATGVFFLISFIYADNFFPGMVFVNAVHERGASGAYKTPPQSPVLIEPRILSGTTMTIFDIHWMLTLYTGFQSNFQLATYSKPLCKGQSKLRLSNLTVSTPLYKSTTPALNVLPLQ